MNPIKTGDEQRCFGVVAGSCFLCGTIHVTQVILIRVDKQMDNEIHLQ
jgi:hypothetical protein